MMFERLIFFSRFWRWHPQVALRYLPIVDKINKLSLKGIYWQDRKGSPLETGVLEVGSGSLGIAPYLGRQVTGVDVEFTGPQFLLLKQVKADATDLPFAEESFDIVVSVDMLEHLPKKKRGKAVYEIVRVAREAVFIGVPCGKKAEDQDRKLHKIYKKKFGISFPFLEEQIQHGLPNEEEMVKYIKDAAKKYERKYDIEVKENLNLTIRQFLMWGWMTRNPIIDILFRKVFLILLPVLRHCNWEPTYRKIFFIKLKKEN